MKLLSIPIGLFILMYAVVSFINWDVYAGNWTSDARAMMVLMWTAMVIFIGPILSAFFGPDEGGTRRWD